MSLDIQNVDFDIAKLTLVITGPSPVCPSSPGVQSAAFSEKAQTPIDEKKGEKEEKKQKAPSVTQTAQRAPVVFVLDTDKEEQESPPTFTQRDTHLECAGGVLSVRVLSTFLSHSETLHSFIFKMTKITKECLLGLSWFDKLESLSFMACPGMKDEALSSLPNYTSKLKILKITHADITDVSLETIGKLIHLEELQLNIVAITGSGLSHLAQLKHLRSLELGCTDIDDVSLSSLLSQRKGIQNLSLFSCPHITDKVVGLITQIKGLKLQCIDIGKTHITDEGFSSLAFSQLQLKSLKTIRALSCAKISKATFDIARSLFKGEIITD